MAKHISIDLGTSNTVISEKNKGIILNEPSVAAVDNKTGRIIAVGNEAKALLGKTPKEISVIAPVENSVVSDFDAACAMMKTFLGSVFPRGAVRPKATICLPHGITDVQKRAMLEAISRSGAKNTYTLDTPLASAVGAGLQVSEPSGNMILDIGGGKASAAVVSFGGIVTATSEACGGNEMDDCIIDYIKKNYDVIVGKKTAEDIKINIGSAYPADHEKTINVIGRDTKSGLPREITVTSSDVREAIAPVLVKIAGVIKKTLENTPEELAKDLSSCGIFLCGGVSNLAGLDKFIEDNIQLGAHLCDNSFVCAALGACTALDTGAAQ